MSHKPVAVGPRPGPSSSPQPRFVNPLTDLNARLFSDPVSPAQPLVGEQKDPIQEILNLARISNRETAKQLYIHALKTEDESKHPLFYAICEVELAYLFNPAPEQKEAYAKSAFTRWEKMHEKGILGDELITLFKHLERCFNRLSSLLPGQIESLTAQMDSYKKHTQLWQNFKKLVSDADEVSETNVEQASEKYQDALELIEDETAPFYKLHRVDCMMKLTLLHKETKTGSQWANEAKELFFEIVESEDQVDLDHLDRLLKDLEALYKDEPALQKEISDKRQSLRAKPEMSSEEKKEVPQEGSEKERRVSREIDDRGLTYLFMALAVGTLIGVAAFMLYRRNVVKL